MAQPLELVSDRSSRWRELREAAEQAARDEPRLSSLMSATILSHDDLAGALSYQIARKLGDAELGPMSVREVCAQAFAANPAIVTAAEADLQAVEERDPAIKSLLQPFLYFKGFQAIQAHRVSHWLWTQGRETLAFHFQSRMSELFQVDIHPAAELGAGAKVLGNIAIGEYAKIASGSVVLKPVPAHCTAAGVPARLVNCPTGEQPARTMDHTLADVADDFVI